MKCKLRKNPNEIPRKISLKLFGRYNGIIDVMSVSIKLSLRTQIFLTIRRPIRDFRPKSLREKSLTNLFFFKNNEMFFLKCCFYFLHMSHNEKMSNVLFFLTHIFWRRKKHSSIIFQIIFFFCHLFLSLLLLYFFEFFSDNFFSTSSPFFHFFIYLFFNSVKSIFKILLLLPQEKNVCPTVHQKNRITILNI